MASHSAAQTATCSETKSANAQAVVTPPAELQPRKRARHDSGTTVGVPPAWLDQAKKRKTSKARSGYSAGLSRDPFADQTPNSSPPPAPPAPPAQQTMSDPIQERMHTPSYFKLKRIELPDIRFRYPSNCQQSHLDELERGYAKALNDIRQLHFQLGEQRRVHEQQVLQTKQTMMLDMITAQETANKKVVTLHREKYYLQQYANEQSEEASNAKGRLNIVTGKYTKALQDVGAYKLEAEHLQDVNKTMEEDLHELRQIENEDAARRRRQAQGLPPAYGALDDEDQLPPYNLHKDNGKFDLASLKKTVRWQFNRALDSAQTRKESLFSSSLAADYAAAGNVIFYSTSIALQVACGRLREALDYAENHFSTRTSESKQALNMVGRYSRAPAGALCKLEPPCDFHENRKNITLQEARREVNDAIAHFSHVAERVAKLILDLSWRIIGASELRPTTLCFTPQEKAKLGLAYKEADECLLEALRHAFSAASNSSDHKTTAISFHRVLGASPIVFDYKSYLTQLEAVKKKLLDLKAEAGYPYFANTIEWLDEKVEVERFQQASNRARTLALTRNECTEPELSARAIEPRT